MSLVECRAAIVDVLAQKLTGVTVIDHGGAFTPAEVERYVTKPPAVVVTCLGVTDLNQGAAVMAEVAWSVFVFTTSNASKAKRDAQGLTIVESILAIVGSPLQQNWNGKATSRPTRVMASNMYDSTLDAKGTSLWRVTWRQGTDLKVGIPFDSLDDFLRFDATYHIGTPDAPETSDEVELPGP